MGSNHSCVEPRSSQLARPMVGAAAGFHRDQRAWLKLLAPGHEAVARQRLRDNDSPSDIDRMNLDHARPNRPLPAQ